MLSIDQALPGKAAGVQVSTSSGLVGDVVNTRIRGAASISSGSHDGLIASFYHAKKTLYKMKSIKLIAPVFLKISSFYLILFVFGSCKKSGDTPPDNTIPRVFIDSLKILTSNIPAAMYTDLAFVDLTTGFSISQWQIIKASDGGYNRTSVVRHFIFNC